VTAPKTGLEQGITRFGLLLARVTAILTVAILVVNLVLSRPVADPVRPLALAVGLTPQLLPAIVAVSLATGARRMARQQVIVRRLDAMQDALDTAGQPSSLVAAVAARNAALQRGFANPIDAVRLHPQAPECWLTAPAAASC
jgi:Mg2+-importing ATPase